MKKLFLIKISPIVPLKQNFGAIHIKWLPNALTRLGGSIPETFLGYSKNRTQGLWNGS